MQEVLKKQQSKSKSKTKSKTKKNPPTKPRKEILETTLNTNLKNPKSTRIKIRRWKRKSYKSKNILLQLFWFFNMKSWLSRDSGSNKVNGTTGWHERGTCSRTAPKPELYLRYLNLDTTKMSNSVKRQIKIHRTGIYVFSSKPVKKEK